MNSESPKKDLLPDEAATEGDSTVQRSGSGADTALIAMLRKRQMRAGSEPQPQPPDGGQARQE